MSLLIKKKDPLLNEELLNHLNIHANQIYLVLHAVRDLTNAMNPIYVILLLKYANQETRHRLIMRKHTKVIITNKSPTGDLVPLNMGVLGVLDDQKVANVEVKKNHPTEMNTKVQKIMNLINITGID